MANRRKVQQLARQLFKLSFDDNARLSSDRIGGVLEWVEKHRPPEASAVLRAYKHLVENELSQNRAVVEYAGGLDEAAIREIGVAMSERYGRAIETVSVERPELVAGVRVRVGCDVYENSVVSQLAALNASSP